MKFRKSTVTAGRPDGRAAGDRRPGGDGAVHA